MSNKNQQKVALFECSIEITTLNIFKRIIRDIIMQGSKAPMNKYKNLKIKSREPKREKIFEESLLARAFTEIMPEVEFIDATPRRQTGKKRLTSA